MIGALSSTDRTIDEIKKSVHAFNLSKASIFFPPNLYFATKRLPPGIFSWNGRDEEDPTRAFGPNLGRPLISHFRDS